MASAAAEVRALGPGDDAQRDRLVRAHPRGSVHHLAAWRRAVARAFGHEPLELGAWREGRLAGVLPMMLCRKPIGPPDLVSMPYGVYGGPLGEDAALEAELARAALALAEERRVGRLELRCESAPGIELATSDLYATFVRDLPRDPAEILKRMPKRARAEVRKSIERHGLSLREGGDLGLLARQFGASKQELGSPGLPPGWFEALSGELGEACVLHQALREGRVVASTLSFACEGTLAFYYIGTAPGANREWNVTNFLCARLQEWAVERGFRRFDLSRSRVGSGSYAFKEHQGLSARPLPYRYGLVRRPGLPSLNPSNPRTRLLQRVWSRLPPGAARRLSAVLARYLV